MSRVEEEAIVLEVYEREEADRGVALLGEGGELIVVHAPAAARSRRRFGGALGLGTKIRASRRRKREGARWILLEATTLREPPPPDPLVVYYATAHVLELARAFAREGAGDPRLFRLIDAVVGQLAEDVPVEPLLRYTEAWILRLAGLMPNLRRCAECGESLEDQDQIWLAPEMGAFCGRHRPARAERISHAAAEWVGRTADCPPGDAPELAQEIAGSLRTALVFLIESFTGQRLRALRAWLRAAREID